MTHDYSEPDEAHASPKDVAGFLAPSSEATVGGPSLDGLRLHSSQIFVAGFENPNTPFERLLINWQTGTGKSIGMLSIGQRFVRQFQQRPIPPQDRPTVFVIAQPGVRTIIQREMLRHPEFGFISFAELEELNRIRLVATKDGLGPGPASVEARYLAGYLGVLKRRITDRSRGGYYQFYGYKEFANHMFTPTRKGIEAKFDIQELYSRSSNIEDEDSEDADTAMGEPVDFVARLDRAVNDGLVAVNTELLEKLRGGLLVADEIHHVYNIAAKNNYGIAIQYALDFLSREASGEPEAQPPRAVFMSATIASGSATEAVDLLNLLIPPKHLPGGKILQKETYFSRSGGILRLKPGAVDALGRLSAGRVSYLLDTDIKSYPRRILAGVEIPGIPYLRFRPCPMTPWHLRTLEHAAPEAAKAHTVPPIASNAYALLDMSFPNPEFAPRAAADGDPVAYGLYVSTTTPSVLATASDTWKGAAGVIVDRSSRTSGTDGPQIITGAFLKQDNIAPYTAKYHALIKDILDILCRGEPGKIMVYHHWVQMSGILLLQELLRMNGFADETSPATPSTICAICGSQQRTHKADHEYMPARFVVAHYHIERATIERSIEKYNASTNLLGYEYRIILGSKIVSEGRTFIATRFQMIMSLPVDISGYLQVLGRLVRKESHAELPLEMHTVRVETYVSTNPPGSPFKEAPEVYRYTEKMKDYLIIQEVERAFRRYAVDASGNYGRIVHAQPGVATGKSTLDALPYEPIIRPFAAELGDLNTSTFEAYGFGDQEVRLIASILRALFAVRPVWQYDDLWAAARTRGSVHGVGVDPSLFDEGNFALAVHYVTHHNIQGPAGPPRRVVHVSPYYVLAAVDPDGRAIIDAESYLREAAPPAVVRIPIAKYVTEARTHHNFGVQLEEFERRYGPGGNDQLEIALVEYGEEFHYQLLRAIIASQWGKTSPLARRAVPRNSALARIIRIYRVYRIAITAADAMATKETRAILRAEYVNKPPTTLVGYVTPSAIILYDPTAKGGATVASHWYEIPRAVMGYGRRVQENNIVVGYIEPKGGRQRFKLRPPLHILEQAKVRDIRSLARGAVCETRPRDELECIVCRLGVARRRRAAHIPTAELCGLIRTQLLELEKESRAQTRGMQDSIRWFYLFNDDAPSVTLIARKK